LQCVTVCCSVLQCVAVCCSVLQCIGKTMVVHWTLHRDNQIKTRTMYLNPRLTQTLELQGRKIFCTHRKNTAHPGDHSLTVWPIYCRAPKKKKNARVYSVFSGCAIYIFLSSNFFPSLDHSLTVWPIYCRAPRVKKTLHNQMRTRMIYCAPNKNTPFYGLDK